MTVTLHHKITLLANVSQNIHLGHTEESDVDVMLLPLHEIVWTVLSGAQPPLPRSACNRSMSYQFCCAETWTMFASKEIDLFDCDVSIA